MDKDWLDARSSILTREIAAQVRGNGVFPVGFDSEDDRAIPNDPYMIDHALAPWLDWPEGMPGGVAGPPSPGSGHDQPE